MLITYIRDDKGSFINDVIKIYDPHIVRLFRINLKSSKLDDIPVLNAMEISIPELLQFLLTHFNFNKNMFKKSHNG
jgi:hypothetical protein